MVVIKSLGCEVEEPAGSLISWDSPPCVLQPEIQEADGHRKREREAKEALMLGENESGSQGE